MSNAKFTQKIKSCNILVINHEHRKGGVGHVLRDFLLEQYVKNLLFIAHPLLYAKEMYKESSYFEFYTKGKLIKKSKGFHWRLPEPILYFKDFIYSIFWVYKTGLRYDCIVALDPLNSIAALILKFLGKAEKVVYYSIDYFPTRFNNPIMNRIYHLIDKISVRFCDETWNVGGRMSKARSEFNNMKGPKYLKRQHHVPIGVWFSRIKKKPLDKFDDRRLVFAGHFISYMGVDLVIKSLPKIIKKIPNIKLDLVGGGEEKQAWQKLAKKLGVEKNINYQDWISDRENFHLYLSDAAIGLAPFNINILDDKVKNADPGKIKDYASVGLPIITTKAIYTWKDIEKARCGFIINYDKRDFVNAVLKLLTNRDLLLEYRKNALEYARQFDWEEIFTKNISRVLSF